MRKEYLSSILVIATLVFVLLAGTSNAAAVEPVYGGKIVFAIHYSAPISLDPIRIPLDKSYDMGVVRCIHRGLVKLDASTLNIVPGIAKKWEISEDGKVYTFHLRQGAKFHHGREVVADDFKKSFERLMDPEEAGVPTYIIQPVLGVEEYRKGEADEIMGIKVLDPYTLRITLKEVSPLFLHYLAEQGASVIPKEVYLEMGEADFSAAPVGAGPFIIKDWVGDDITIAAFEDYYEGRPYLDEIEFRWMTEAAARGAAFAAREIDVHIPDPVFYGRYQERIPDQLVETAELWTRHIGFNNEWGPFTDKRVRQAFNYAIDTEVIISKYMFDMAYLATGYFPPGLPAYDQELEGYGYDPEKAKELLAKAGYGDGFTVEVIGHPTHPEWGIPAVEATMDFLNKVGIELQPVGLQSAELYARIKDGDYEAYAQSFGGVPTSLGYLSRWHSSRIGVENYVRYNNPEFDRLIDEASREINDELRLDLVRQAERAMVEDAPMFFYNYNMNALAHQGWVHGLVPCPVEHFWQPYWQVWVDEGSPRR